MAWIEGNFVSSAVGSMITMLDAQLPTNANWEIFDNAAWVAPASLVANGDFALGAASWTVGAGWNCATFKAVHTGGGGVAVLSQAITIKSNYYYTVTFTVGAMTAGTITLTHTNLSGTLGAIAAAGTYTYVGLATSLATTLTFTPTTAFDGSIDDVSVVQYCAAANCKVYHCSGAPGVNCDFYLMVEDEHLNFCVPELWEGWDAGTHAGTGQSVKGWTAAAHFRWNRYAGFYKLSLHDNYFTFINGDYSGNFCGRPDLYDDTKNIVMIVSDGSAAARDNNLATWPNNSGGGWAFLFDEAGNIQAGVGPAGLSYTDYYYTKGIDGAYHIVETPVTTGFTKLVVGVLPGVGMVGKVASGLLVGDTVTIAGVDWWAICGEPAGTLYWSLIRKD